MQYQVDMLRTSIEQGKVVPFYQPIIDCKTGKTLAFEVLARLILNNGDIIPADDFKEFIESNDLSLIFNKAIIVKSLHDLHAAQQKATHPIRLFINLSTETMQKHHLLNFAEDLCAELNIPPHQIVFELLERDAITDILLMKDTIATLHNKGFSFALDDFGTGYNSLHYLRELSFQYLKLDGSYVKNMLNSPIDYSLVKNIANLCHDLKLISIAESVESKAILTELCTLGIQCAQGFHIAMPERSFNIR